MIGHSRLTTAFLLTLRGRRGPWPLRRGQTLLCRHVQPRGGSRHSPRPAPSRVAPTPGDQAWGRDGAMSSASLAQTHILEALALVCPPPWWTPPLCPPLSRSCWGGCRSGSIGPAVCSGPNHGLGEALVLQPANISLYVHAVKSRWVIVLTIGDLNAPTGVLLRGGRGRCSHRGGHVKLRQRDLKSLALEVSRG